MAASPNGKGRRIRGVQIAFSIVDLLQAENGRTLTEIADELDHSKSTVHSHLQTLVDEEIVVPTDEGYRLSLRFLDIASHVQNQIGNYGVIETQIEELAEETGEVSQFGIEEYGRVAYLCKARGSQAVETASGVGTYQPLHSTALGKTILTHLDAEERDRLLDGCEFEARTERTITSRDDLLEELDRIAERGYGIDDEENVDGLRCIAAPVKGEESILGAVSVSGPTSQLTDERIHDEVADHVRRAANVIELNTKFS